ncbi:hypothetical protein [Streptomyces sp. NPDC093261]|uniref:hypothetical protein n=1 Tax=Streptomyces sp. NPDC093261 TaxID=3366037 RepID=UPI0037F80580
MAASAPVPTAPTAPRARLLIPDLIAYAPAICLRKEIALVLAVPLIHRFRGVPAFERGLPLDGRWFLYRLGWVLIRVAIPLVGWVEDVAARKKPRLLP